MHRAICPPRLLYRVINHRRRLQSMTTHDLIALLKGISWYFCFFLAAGLWSWFKRSWERRTTERWAREAESWPIVEGQVQSIDLKPHVESNNRTSGYDVHFSYSYRVQENSETEYYSSEFSRTFQDEGVARDWLHAMKDKHIRVHVRPNRPKVSAVLAADLDAQYPLPNRSSGEPGLALVNGPPSLPAGLRGPTETAAWLLTLGFFLSLTDHLYRLLAGRPLHPRLAQILWSAFLGAAIPFGLWYQTKSGESIFGKPKQWARVPAWLRISTYALNLYVGSFWLINMVLASGAFHVHWDLHRLEPMSNGIFLALLYGDAAAILYSQLESLEDPYNLAAQGLHPR
jgi:hypothetical protein